jgi:hypothetical protein
VVLFLPFVLFAERLNQWIPRQIFFQSLKVTIVIRNLNIAVFIYLSNVGPEESKVHKPNKLNLYIRFINADFYITE